MTTGPSGFFCMVLLVAAVSLCGRCLAAQGPEQQQELCPFVLPWDDASPSVTNLSGWNQEPAGKLGRVRAGSDGHLYVGQERIRFFGVDIAFSATIPAKGDAEKVAARMAKFGINVVRFHIMDMQRFPEGILARDGLSTRDFDAEGLDRMDYFIAQLRRNGVYTNLNTLCYRYINGHDGLPPEIEQVQRAEDRNVIGFFYAAALELQKEYARKLLTHRNPYTGLTYAEDPAIAFVEVHNENGLIHAWLAGRVDALPGVFLADLARQWNEWLKQQYGTSERLRAAWGKTAEPLGEEELLANGDFARALDQWYLELPHGAQGAAQTEKDAPADLRGAGSVRISVSSQSDNGVPVRFQQRGLAVREGRHLTISFWGRAEEPCAITVGIEQAHAPWRRLGVSVPARLTDRWTHFHFVFAANATEDQVRLIFDYTLPSGVFSLAGVSLRPGGTEGLREGERIEDGTVPAMAVARVGERTPEAGQDWLRFLWATEDRYWQTMQRYVKDDLKVGALVIGTATGCSTPNLLASMDCEDAHAYWTHPEFPNRPWDPKDWFVRNVPMVNKAGGNLLDLALRRSLGKPQCVTEYGHPAPNTYGGEADILYAAYAALQDWDYISLSRYSQHSDWDIRRMRSWFDIDQDPVRMAGIIPAMAVFRRGDVQPARQEVVAALGKERELELLGKSHAWELVDAGTVGVPREAALLHRVAIATEGQAMPANALKPEQVLPDAGKFVSDTGELVWDVSSKERGVVTVNTAKSKAVIGFGAGKRFELGSVVIEPGDTRENGFSTISVTVLRGDLPVAGAASSPSACQLLVTAIGQVQNSHWGWEDLGDNRVTVRDKWGEPPSLIEVVPARITLPLPAAGVAVWALDERGQRREPVPVEADRDGHAVLRIGLPHRTLWYEVVFG